MAVVDEQVERLEEIRAHMEAWAAGHENHVGEDDDAEPDYPGGWFGPAPFAPVCDDIPHRATPVGELCFDCQVPVVEGDEGLLIPGGKLGPDGGIVYVVDAWHIACFRRHLGVRGGC